MKESSRSLSRRDFARCATLGAAAAAGVIPHGTEALSRAAPSLREQSQNPAEAAKLSPQSLAEAEARYQSILQQYGARFSDAQKTDIRRLCMLVQQSLDAVRIFPITNAEQPSLYLRPLLEREKKNGAGRFAPGGITSKRSVVTSAAPSSRKP